MSKSNKALVPEAKEALNQFKMEAANEVGVFLHQNFKKKLRCSRFICYSCEITNKFIKDFDVLRSMLMNACILD